MRLWPLFESLADLSTRILGSEHDHVLRPRTIPDPETIPDDTIHDVSVAVHPSGEPVTLLPATYLVTGTRSRLPVPYTPPEYRGPLVVVNQLALVGNALALVSPFNPARTFAAHCVTNRYWKLLMVTVTIAHWFLLSCRVWSKGEATRFTLLTAPLESALVPIFAVYNAEILFKLIAFGAFWLPRPFYSSALYTDNDEVGVLNDTRRVDDDDQDSVREQEAMMVLANAIPHHHGSGPAHSPATPASPSPRSHTIKSTDSSRDLEHCGNPLSITEALLVATDTIAHAPAASSAITNPFPRHNSYTNANDLDLTPKRGASPFSPPANPQYLIPKPFLHSPVNQFDLIAVLAFWLYIILGSMGISAPLWILRGLSASRPFRLLSATRGTRVIMASFRASRRLLRNVAVFTAFFFLVFALASVFSFKGSYQRQCALIDPSTGNLGALALAGSPDSLRYCTGSVTESGLFAMPVGGPLVSNTTGNHYGYLCPFPQVCLNGQDNPWYGFASFDNFATATVLQYTIMSGENWGSFMYACMDAESPSSAIYFVFTIIVLGFLVLQLFIAVMTETFGSVREAYFEAKEFSKAETEISLDSSIGSDSSNAFIHLEEDTPFTVSSLKMYMRQTAVLVQNSRMWQLILFSALAVYTVILLQVASMPSDQARAEKLGQYWVVEVVFTAVFAIELLMYPVVLPGGWWQTFQEHPADTVLSLGSFVVLFVPFDRYLTFFQVFRTYKLVTYIPPVRKLIVFTKRFAGLSSVVLFITMAISATATYGMQMFGGAYESASNNFISFDNFGSAWLLVYAGLLIGDNWTEIMWDCMKAHSESMPIIGPIVGTVYIVVSYSLLNFIVLNLLIVVVLDIFEVDDDVKRAKQVDLYEQQAAPTFQIRGKAAVINSWWTKFQSWVAMQRRTLGQRLSQSGTANTLLVHRPEPFRAPPSDHDSASSDMPSTEFARDLYLRREQPNFSSLSNVVSPSTSNIYKQDLVPASQFMKANPGSQQGTENQSRSRVQKFVESRWFTVFIFITVLASVATATVDTPIHRLERRAISGITGGNDFSDPFVVADLGVCVIFGAEFLAKLWAYQADYFRDPWNILDLCVLVTMGLSYTVDESTAAAMRMARALRPLKAIVYLPGVQGVFAALVVGLPRILSAIAFSMLILLPYALYGMFLFSNALMQCNDSAVESKAECVGVFVNDLGLLTPRVWDNYFKRYNFDSLSNSLITLFVMASSEGWTDLLRHLMAVRGEGIQPAADPSAAPAAFYYLHALFGISFMLLGYCFTLNLFIGIVIRSFDETSGDAFLTKPQKAWNTACKRISATRPVAVPPPKEKRTGLGAYLGDHLNRYSGQFGTFVTCTMLLHVLLMCLEHSNQPEWVTSTQHVMFQVFVVVFFSQTVLLMTEKGAWFYFKKSLWNGFELLVNTLGVLFIIIQAVLDSDALVQLQRLLLVAYALRLARRVNGLHTLFKTMRASASDLIRVFLVLAIILLFFASVSTEIFGLTRFGTSYYDFGTVRSTFKSLLLFFRLVTGDDWPGIMQDLAVSDGMCVAGDGSTHSDCGQPVAAIILFISFFLVCTWVLLNLIIALLVNNFDYCFSANQVPIIADECLKSFQIVWSTLDPKGTGLIPKSQISKLLSRNTLQKVDFKLAQDRRWQSSILSLDLVTNCKDEHLAFHTALMTLCLHIIPLHECLTYEQYKARVEYVRQLSHIVAQERFKGIFVMAIIRRRFRRRRQSVGPTRPHSDEDIHLAPIESINPDLT